MSEKSNKTDDWQKLCSPEPEWQLTKEQEAAWRKLCEAVSQIEEVPVSEVKTRPCDWKWHSSERAKEGA